MQIEHDHRTDKLTVIESSTPMRLLGGVFALAGALALLFGPVDAIGKFVFGAFIPVGVAIAVFASARIVVCDPRTETLVVRRRNLLGEHVDRIGYASVDAICFVREAGRRMAGGGYSSGTFQLIARTSGGRRIGLSAAASWHRDAKQEAGAALADAIGTAFEY